MTIEEAIKTAIELENNVRDVYHDAVAKVHDPAGKKVFTVLAREEQRHVDYLESRMAEWRDSGHVNPAELTTAIPAQREVDRAAHELSVVMSQEDRGTEMELLRRALEAERRTSGFYKKMVTELPPEGQKLFERFVEIEEGHLDIVQAEIDSLTGTGAWFHALEVNLES
jgi:rubrerythrin